MNPTDIVLQRLDHAFVLTSKIVEPECRQNLSELLWKVRLKWISMSPHARAWCRTEVLELLDTHIGCFRDLRQIGGMAV